MRICLSRMSLYFRPIFLFLLLSRNRPKSYVFENKRYKDIISDSLVSWLLLIIKIVTVLKIFSLKDERKLEIF